MIERVTLGAEGIGGVMVVVICALTATDSARKVNAKMDVFIVFSIVRKGSFLYRCVL